MNLKIIEKGEEVKKDNAEWEMTMIIHHKL